MIALCTAWLGWEHSWRVGFLPRSLRISRILYANERIFGLGPGGNEAGIIVYALSSNAAAAALRGGVSYLEGRPGQGRSLYRDWKATPMKAPVRVFGRVLGSTDICDVICAGPEAAGVHADPQIIRQVNQSLAQRGSYYSSGPNGLLVVSPASRRAVFAYAK